MSWYQLLDIRKQAQMEFDHFADVTSHVACPHDGEPLRTGPDSDAGAGVDLWCRFDGYQDPRDYIRPQRL